jgi:translation initiation factor 4E
MPSSHYIDKKKKKKKNEKNSAIMAAEDEKQEQNEQIVALRDSLNFNVKHPLQNKWTLWFDSQQKKATQQNWHDNLKKLITVETVEDFWG